MPEAIRLDRVSSTTYMYVVLRYCRAHNVPCRVVHTRPEDLHVPYTGTAAELLDINEREAHIRWANGSTQWVPVSQVAMDVL